MKLEPKKCPCGCKNIILDPVCRCQCSSVDAATAHDIAIRVNRHDDLMAMLEALVLNRPHQGGLTKMARELLDTVKKEKAAAPDFPSFPWARNGG